MGITLEAIRGVVLEDVPTEHLDFKEVAVGASVVVRQVMEVVIGDDGRLYDEARSEVEKAKDERGLQRIPFYSPRVIKGEVLALYDDGRDGKVIQIRPSDKDNFGNDMPDALVPVSEDGHWVGTRLPDSFPYEPVAGLTGRFAASYQIELLSAPNAEQQDHSQYAA